MKYFGIILLILVAFTSCDSSKAVVKEGDVAAVSNDTIQIANVGLEYEIVFIEPGFESWLVTQKPKGYYGQSFLEGRNRLFVTEFNRRVQNFQWYDRNIYELEINYDFNLDYGYQVNYMLYNYFLYFQERYNQSFIGGRRNTQWRN